MNILLLSVFLCTTETSKTAMMTQWTLVVCWLLCTSFVVPTKASFSLGVVITMVDLTTTTANNTKLAATAAAGLLNRMAPSVYLINTPYDALWFTRLNVTTSLGENTTVDEVSPAQFLASAMVQSLPVIVYASEELFSLPAVLTLAGVLGAIPITEAQLANGPWSALSTTIIMNASNTWSSQEESLAFVADTVLNDTTSVAFQRPSDLVQGYLVDYIVSEKLFTQYMTNGCVPFTTENVLLKRVIHESPWPRPIRVYGYNGLDVLFGGDLFEAETDCIHSMGQVATETASNLAFWKHIAPFAPGETLHQTPPPPETDVVYNANKSYVALVYGDMDNIDFVQTFGSDHMVFRHQQCSGASSSTSNHSGVCFPLTWTLSPNLISFSPAMMRWYFDMGTATGADWFIMPPSGTLYAYPGMMDNATQEKFVVDQTQQATIMNTSGSVHWEWFFAWDGAWNHYFPRYQAISAEQTTTRAFFLNDVPWVIPIPDMWLEGETYRFVGSYNDTNPVVGFKPAFNWQEGSAGGGNPGNASQIAALINDLNSGSVQYVYVIQNTDVAHLFDMVTMLQDHVELVDYQSLVSLAVQREQLRSREGRH